LEMLLTLKNKMIVAFGEKALDLDEVYKSSLKAYKKLAPYIKETFAPLQTAIKQKKNLIFEGAQGTFLDNDWGTYPFCTASSTVAGNIHAGSGVSPRLLTDITGVAKAYTTRVGSGPFPTELFETGENSLQKIGDEFGATTGRARRCGWLDLELVKFAADLNGFTGLVITKLDVLDTFKSIKVAIGYKFNGKKVNYVDLTAEELGQVTPIYKTMKGWNKPLNQIKKFADLPPAAKIYLKFITKFIGVPIEMVSVGVERDQVIKINRKDLT
jgi:adenylosuccinate synthase